MRPVHEVGLVALGLTLAGTAFPGVANAATNDYPVTTFRVASGQSYVEGSVTWYSRSIDIQGAIKAVTSEKTAIFYPANGGSCGNPDGDTRTAAAGTTRSFHFTETCDVPGGFTVLTIDLTDAATGRYDGAIACYAYGCGTTSIEPPAG